MLPLPCMIGPCRTGTFSVCQFTQCRRSTRAQKLTHPLSLSHLPTLLTLTSATMQPSSPRFTTLTYKSAASSARATSELDPSWNRPYSQRSITSLGDASRTMSLSCIPQSAAQQNDHMCSRCAMPPASTSFSVMEDRSRMDGRSRPDLWMKRDGWGREGRAREGWGSSVFSRDGRGRDGWGRDGWGRDGWGRADQPRRIRSAYRAPSLAYRALSGRRNVPRQNSMGTLPRRTVYEPVEKGGRIVVRRRLVRGSCVFREATERDVEEMLGNERYREMVKCVSASVDIPPAVEDRKRRRRMSSMMGGGGDLLDVKEMACLDEGVALGVFLKEVRRVRKEMGKKKIKEVGKKLLERSVSADDAELMRALLRQEEVMRGMKRKKVEEERSRSELLERKEAERREAELDERWKRVGEREDEECAKPVRVLTAMEPVDPSLGDGLRRGTSYHMGGGRKKWGWRFWRARKTEQFV